MTNVPISYKYELQTPLRVSKLDVVSKHTVHIKWSQINGKFCTCMWNSNYSQGRTQGGGGGGSVVSGPPPPPPTPPLAISRATCAFNLFITSDAYGYKAYFVNTLVFFKTIER